MTNKIKNNLLALNCYLKMFLLKFLVVKFKKIKPLVSSDFNNKFSTCTVIGNGPSLKNDIETILKIKNSDYFCVNHMAESEYFETLRPNKYALLDEYFWSLDADEKLKEKRKILFTALNLKLSWDLIIYVPRVADIEFLKKNITNPNVKFKHLNLIATSVINYHKLPVILLKGIYTPPTCNVIIFAMYLAILAGYKHINLYGADLSFTEDVIVDQNNNQLLIEYKHFYGENTFEPLLMNPERKKPFTMESLYKATYLTFYAHNLLNQMAQIKGINIKNRSSYSLIDAYDRK